MTLSVPSFCAALISPGRPPKALADVAVCGLTVLRGPAVAVRRAEAYEAFPTTNITATTHRATNVILR